MEISEYLAKNGTTEYVVEFNDPLNSGYARKAKITGAKVLSGFMPEHYNKDVRVDAYVEPSSRISLFYMDPNGEDDELASFIGLEDLLTSDDVAENVKSAIAAELGEEYIEEYAL